MRVTGEANEAWNENAVSLIKVDGVFLICIHEHQDEPDTGKTVEMSRDDLRAFFKMCLHMLDVLEDA